MKTVKLGALAITFLALAACSARSDENIAGASEDLLSVDDGFAEDVSVQDDRLELPFRGHEDVLAFEKGKILVGGPTSKEDDSANPRGFLRRVEEVHRDGDRVIIETSPAVLTDVFKGDVELSNTTVLDPRDPRGGRVTPQAEWSGSLSTRIDIPPRPIFTKQLQSGPVTWDIDVGVNAGYIDFVPSVSTDIKLSGASLQHVKLVANGKVDADVSVGLKIAAQNPTDTESGLQTFEKVLYTAPRVRWSQLIGFVPVWESLEARLLIRCGVRVRASVKANVGFHATAELTAGGLWKKGEGLQGILEGPSVEFTPRWDASVGGDVYAKCALLPQITLYVYDAAGPSLTAGPYVDGGLRRPPSGPTSWNASAGFSADIGGRVSLFGYDLVDEHKNLIDRKFGSWNGTLPF